MNIQDIVYTQSQYNKDKYGFRVFKLALDSGYECARRENPCAFCVENTFADSDLSEKSITQQVDYLIEKLSKKVKAQGYIAYFQDISHYNDLADLQAKIKEAESHLHILELILAIRPDCLSRELLDMLSSIKKPITIELGVQSVNDNSLLFLNRGHSAADNQRAIEMLQDYPYRCGVHLILGIPGDDIDSTQYFVNNNQIIKDVKLHHLAVFEGSALAKTMPAEQVISLDRYIAILAYFIQNLREDITVSRLFTSNLSRQHIMLNDFPGVKREWLNRFCNYMKGK